ncbi:unnamed protein product [Paramecium pentaurelia]|uniref:Uncharacterized protein n=1 Tax=Paramecium pentaurelia TaxID=43138 RepID=A0A8S1U2Z7_9CILI|nr:unnamed protein product [Paramecium pentaurelia]
MLDFQFLCNFYNVDTYLENQSIQYINHSNFSNITKAEILEPTSICILRELINFKYLFPYPESQICSRIIQNQFQNYRRSKSSQMFNRYYQTKTRFQETQQLFLNLFMLMNQDSIYYKLIMFLFIISSKIIYQKWQDHLQLKKWNISFSKKLNNLQMNKKIDYNTNQKQIKQQQTEKSIENQLKKLLLTYKNCKRTQSFINKQEDWKKDQKYKKRIHKIFRIRIYQQLHY